MGRAGGPVAPGQLSLHASTDGAPAGGRAARPWGGRIRDFLTDGSVAALCDELARLTNVPIWLRDSGEGPTAEAVIPVWSDDGAEGSGHGHPWSIVPEPVARARAFDLLRLKDDGSYETYGLPMRISTGVLGSLVACLPKRGFVSTAGSPEALKFQAVRRGLLLLSSILCDVCESQVSLNRRVSDLDALYRLSSLLAAAGDTDDLAAIALDLSMQVLGADAGSVILMDETAATASERCPHVAAFRGLGPEWIAQTCDDPADAGHRAALLAGSVVRTEDLSRDPLAIAADRVRAEGLRAMLATALFDQGGAAGDVARERGRPIGFIHLYTRSPRVFTESDAELLRAIAEHSATALVNARLRSLRREDEAVKRQLKLAAAVQRRMLPRSIPRMPPFDIAAHYAPSFELGGDFYDFIELGGHLGLLIGDVVGKGTPAALLMSSVRASFRAHAQHLYHIDELFVRVNKALCRDTLDTEFATVWYGVADPDTLRLTYCGAGHDWPLILRVPPRNPDGSRRAIEDKDVLRLTADGMALGIDPAQKYPQGMFQLAAGDVLVTFTDGLHDATNFEGKRFGGTRLRRALLELLAAEPDAPPARVIDHVIAQVRQHTGMSGRNDDMTMVVMRVGGK